MSTKSSKGVPEDIPWSPLNTWIVVGVSAALLLFVVGGAALYETLFKPNSFEPIQGKCEPVRNGTYASMEACLKAC